MNAKQARFVAEYLKDLNATQAAIRSGYSAKWAEKNATRLTGNNGIARAIAAGQARQLAIVDLAAIDVLRVLACQVKGDIRRLFNANNLKPISDLSFEEAALIAGVEVVIKNAEAGDGHTDKVIKIKLKDQARFVEMAAKHFGLLTDRIEHSGELTLRHELPD